MKPYSFRKVWSPPSRDIVEKPELRVYTDGFDTKSGDNCLVAIHDGKIVGAVWTRIMNDYGHVDDETPSFAISLYKEYRRKGIGTRLMEEMLEIFRDQGYKRVSLAVQKASNTVIVNRRAKTVAAIFNKILFVLIWYFFLFFR